MQEVTYCPEDNKLRLYVGRVPRDEYERLRKAGFSSTPKQDCDFVATWTPAREDLAREYLDDDDDIADEDYSPEERAADRAERFGGYRDKRRAEATNHADTFDAGPGVFGHQNRQRAERQAARHDRERAKAVSQWSKAEYWQTRTAGVISHALHKSSARVRRGRILEIEKDIRRVEASYTPNPKHGKIQQTDDDGNTCVHVWIGHGRGGWWVPEASLEARKRGAQRELEHLRMRLIYENAMLENEGGTVAAVDIEPGGWFGTHQVHKVNKSPATGRVTSVMIRGEWGYVNIGGRRAYVDHSNADGLAKMSIERLGEDAYRPPTAEELEAFKADQKAAKAKAKASAPKKPGLVNPTDEDAERLQSVLNTKAKERHDASDNYCKRDFEPATVSRMTQGEYSAASKGSYSTLETRTLHNSGGIISRQKSNMWSSHGKKYDEELGAAVCKVRTRCPSGFSGYTPQRIVVITDKPQKPLPLDWFTLGEPQPIEPPADEPLNPRFIEAVNRAGELEKANR